MSEPACRDCGYTGRGLVASMIPGEHYCASRRACEARQRRALAGANHGAWGTSPKWGRKRGKAAA